MINLRYSTPHWVLGARRGYGALLIWLRRDWPAWSPTDDRPRRGERNEERGAAWKKTYASASAREGGDDPMEIRRMHSMVHSRTGLMLTECLTSEGTVRAVEREPEVGLRFRKVSHCYYAF